MVEWMNECYLDGWMNEWMLPRWLNEWMNECVIYEVSCIAYRSLHEYNYSVFDKQDIIDPFINKYTRVSL